MKKILIVVDMQNDFVCGSLGSDAAMSIVENVRAKISEYKKNGDTIVFTRDTHLKNYLKTQEGKNLPVEHCIHGTEGWEIYDGLDDGNPENLCIDKFSFGYPYWGSILSSTINDTEEIELCGLCSDICVVSNALIIKAFFPEVKITVDASCCAGVTQESHEAALLTMKMCQVNIIG